jgi:L-fucose isomerase-like protein
MYTYTAKRPPRALQCVIRMRYEYIVTIKHTVEAETVEEGKKAVSSIMEMLGIQSFHVEHKEEKRTIPQNNALHKYCDDVAQHANEMGLTMSALIKNPIEFPITKEIVKEFISEIAFLLFQERRTSKLTKKQLSQVIDMAQGLFAERLDYHLPFPSIENLI